MPPKIAINGRFLTQRSSGVQRFAAEAIKAMDALLDTNYAALKGRIELVAPRQARDFPLKNIPLRRAGRFSGYVWDTMPVCYESADHITTVEVDDAVIERLGLKGRKFFLGVGVDSSNKNIKTVVEAFRRARLNDAALVLTGARDPRVFGTFNLAKSAGVHLVDYVSDAELRALYEQTLALVFPSLYEGFGLPPLEAMTCGCPVIVSEQPALIEMCDGAALHCPAEDTEAIMLNMRALCNDAGLRARLMAAGRAQARCFTWAATAHSLLDHCLRLNAERAA